MYEHTQRSVALIPFVALIEGVLLAVLIIVDAGIVPIIVVVASTGLVLTVIVVFSRLTVEVGSTEVHLHFGSAWPNKTIPISSITSAERVRNRWWYGWGIRKVPRGWLWNVWGLDAVELSLDTGKMFRIGTDDADGLLAALSQWVPTT